MDRVYKTLCKVLNQFDAIRVGIRDEHCCLCLDEIDENEETYHISDECNYKGDASNNLATETMFTIISETLGEKIADMMTIFTSVCQKCATSVLNIYKFKKQCQYVNESFNQVFSNLDDCFGNVSDSLNQYKCLYVSINTDNSMIEQIYDIKRVEKKSLASHFTELVQERTIRRKIHGQRDFSTIFIKTPQLMADPNSKEFKCKMCSKICSTAGALRQHFFSVHFKKDFKCDQCSKSFGTQGLLNTHIKACHSLFRCEICGKVLINRTRTRARHMMLHNKQKPMCLKCGRTYKLRKNFLKHMERENCEVPSRIAGDYACNDCNKHFKIKHQLASHIKFEHGNADAHICKWCGKKYYSKSALETHVLKHTGVKNFVCHECGGKFVTRQSLLNHSRLHTGERPYPCGQCEQSFLSASRRKEHLERNHVGFRFECDICGSKCSSRRSMSQHKKKHFTSIVESEDPIKIKLTDS